MVPIPGHSDLSVALYDRNTAILLPGDSLYPGRLYVHDFAAFQASTERLVKFTEGKPVSSHPGQSHRTDEHAVSGLSGGNDVPAERT